MIAPDRPWIEGGMGVSDPTVLRLFFPLHYSALLKFGFAFQQRLWLKPYLKRENDSQRHLDPTLGRVSHSFS